MYLFHFHLRELLLFNNVCYGWCVEHHSVTFLLQAILELFIPFSLDDLGDVDLLVKDGILLLEKLRT